MPGLACQQVKKKKTTIPQVPSSKDRRQESVAGPKSEEWYYPENDDVVRLDTWQLAGRMVSQRVNTHQWMIQDLLPVMLFI